MEKLQGAMCGGLSVTLRDRNSEAGLIACHESGVIPNVESNWNPPGVVLWSTEC